MIIFQIRLCDMCVCRFGHPFEIPLLIQSIVMNITMFAMIQLCVNVQQRSELGTRRRSFAGLLMSFFILLLNYNGLFVMYFMISIDVCI